jgi:hypothetical protein
VVARFHGGQLDGQLITGWPEPPAPAVWAEQAEDGVIATEEPQAGEGVTGFDRYALAEVVADLAVYHFAEPQ